jgi:ATP-dependent RNA helicase DeaD
MDSFSELAIPDAIKKALVKLNFTTPTEVQKHAMPVAFEGKDIIACASTGSGKTGAFGIPMMTMVLNTEKNGLILAPTRELAQQIAEFIRCLTSHCEGITIASLIGGSDMSRQLQSLKRRPRIIIATPGRLTDHLRRRTVSLKNTGMLVLDEGDRMLDMGFAPQLDVILQFVPQERQTMLFTATLPPKVRVLASKYLQKPQEIFVGNISQPVDTVDQSAISVPQEMKNDKLVEELNKRTGSVIIFARTQRRTDAVADYLHDSGFAVGAIHGGLTQGKRNRAIQGFKHGEFRVLCATDIAARGLDVPSVEHVINYDIPLMDEDYVHRVGRTARNGAKGEAISFVSNHEYGLWAVIARKYNVGKNDVQDPRASRMGKKKAGGRRDRANRISERHSMSEQSFGKKDNSFFEEAAKEMRRPAVREEYAEKKNFAKEGFDKKPRFSRGTEGHSESRSEGRGFGRRSEERSFGSKRNDSFGGEGKRRAFSTRGDSRSAGSDRPERPRWENNDERPQRRPLGGGENNGRRSFGAGGGDRNERRPLFARGDRSERRSFDREDRPDRRSFDGARGARRPFARAEGDDRPQRRSFERSEQRQENFVGDRPTREAQFTARSTDGDDRPKGKSSFFDKNKKRRPFGKKPEQSSRY